MRTGAWRGREGAPGATISVLTANRPLRLRKHLPCRLADEDRALIKELLDDGSDADDYDSGGDDDPADSTYGAPAKRTLCRASDERPQVNGR